MATAPRKYSTTTPAFSTSLYIAMTTETSSLGVAVRQRSAHIELFGSQNLTHFQLIVGVQSICLFKSTALSSYRCERSINSV